VSCFPDDEYSAVFEIGTRTAYSGGVVMVANPSSLPAHSILPEPRLLFQGSRTDTHPLRGLSQYGPYSADLGLPGMVRLAYLAPAGYMRKLDDIGV